MPRVETKTKFNMGAERKCGACGRVIEPGQKYHTWKFRYGGRRFACSDHYPRPSQLTQSKMSAVYAAIENAEDLLPVTTDVESVRGLIEEVSQAVQEVAEEYREADEAFGGTGATEMAERADELESWGSELESFDPDDPDEGGEEPHEALDRARDDATDLLGGCPL